MHTGGVFKIYKFGKQPAVLTLRQYMCICTLENSKQNCSKRG